MRIKLETGHMCGGREKKAPGTFNGMRHWREVAEHETVIVSLTDRNVR